MNQRAMIAVGGVFGILLRMAIGGMHLLAASVTRKERPPASRNPANETVKPPPQ